MGFKADTDFLSTFNAHQRGSSPGTVIADEHVTRSVRNVTIGFFPL